MHLEGTELFLHLTWDQGENSRHIGMQAKTMSPMCYFFESKQISITDQLIMTSPDQVHSPAGAALRPDHTEALEHLRVVQKWRKKEERFRGVCEDQTWYAIV